MTEKTWEEGGANEQVLRITEFRGNGRQRYLVRGRDPNDPTQFLPDPVWTLYDDVKPYEDYTVSWNGQDYDINVLTGYELGLGQVDWVSGETSYFHMDQIGSTRLMTDSLGTIHDSRVYSAFGEQIDGSLGTRYGYAGAWGYEDLTATSSPLTANLMHVGYRHFSPSTGRFLERDPIGIFGGLNVYAYVGNNPLSHVDPDGMIFGFIKRAWRGLKGWVKNLCTPKNTISVGKKCSLDAMGKSSPISKVNRVFGAPVQATQAAPDVARIYLGKSARDRLIDDLYKSDDDGYDRYERNRKKVMPRE